MKEINEVKNDSLTIYNKEGNALSSDGFAIKLEEIEAEGPTLVDDKAQDVKLERLSESSSSKDLINDTETVSTELTENESKDCLIIETEKEIKEETDENVCSKTLVLRPRKLDSNQSSEEFCKGKKLRSVNKKVDKKSAISKANEDVVKCDEISLVCETDKHLSIASDSNTAVTEERVDDVPRSADFVPQIKTEPPDSTQNSVSSSENDGGSYENMLISKSPDDNSSKSKENSESDTRISSASENSVNKVSSKRKKRRRDLWTKKRKRNDGGHAKEGECNLLLGNEAGFEWTLNGNASLSINGNVVNNGQRCSETNNGSQKINQEFAPPSQSLAAFSAKPVLPVSGPTPPEGSRTILCLCAKKPNIYISGNNNSGDLYCQALDSVDKRIIGCCNPIPSQDVALFRPSKRVSYQMMCEVHQQRLFRHNCCPGCGLFCTQGRYMMCTSYHHYHRLCGVENDSNSVVCPHCGDDTPPKAIIISIHSAKDPIFLPNQKSLRKEKSAKISISRGSLQESEEKEEDPTFQFPASLFNVGDEISPSNGFTSNLHRDKLAHLLNIACRSFSKLCCSNSRYTYRTLYNTSHNGDAEKLLKIIASGLNPNYVFEEHKRQTPLHIASASGHLSLVHILLQAKAEINAMDGEQNTPLTAAISAKHNDVVKYLVKCGADLLLKGEDGMTPLHIAAKSGNVGACFHLLNGTHLPVRYIDSLDDGGWTPMVWASEFNHIEVVKFLISKGADPLIKDAEQNIALHWAAFGGSIDIVELYLNDGSDINAVNVHGDTPLHIAARQDKYSCVLLLLARGAKSDIRNKSGELPRDCGESPESDIYKAITLNMEISSLLTRFKDSTPRIISNDISRGKERNQIQCVNAVDNEDEPKDYIYVSESCFTSKIPVDRTINSLQSCKCQNNCGTETCNCATISIKCWYDNEGKLKPDFNYSDPPMIFECNQACMCNRITCHNRVVQNGISCRFQLFRTEGKGWGIKTLNSIPKGTYVCEYVGEIISDCEADHREDDSYLFDLDNRDGETYCIDARYYGNFARFINHMCVPNLMPVHVFVDHQDLRFPRIAFFAKTDILPGEELGYNYGEKFWVIKWKSFTCTCGAEKCMYSETTIQTTLENYKKKLMDENP